MRVIAFRHGTAEDAGGGADADRALTEAGRTRTRAAGLGLRAQSGRIDVILSSPLLRAWQTAELLAQVGEGPDVTLCRALAPGHPPAALASVLRGHDQSHTVVMVGHQPDLGNWVAWALSGQAAGFIPLKKAGAARVDFDLHDLHPASGAGALRWLMTADQLAAVSGATM